MAAAAAVRRPIASKKRKVSADLPLSGGEQQQPPKKKSPLFNKPQNYYAPPASLSKEEVSEWRKEQRRKRNRESAAASRKKIQGRIGELEGELDEWKKKYSELEHKMRCMERHIDLLTKMNGGSSLSSSTRDQASSPTTVSHPVSHPNSPPRSPVANSAPVPNEVASSSSVLPPPPAYSSHATNVPNAFPPLLSELPKDTTEVETQKVVTNSVVPIVAKVTTTSNDESKKHIKSISRQAVKSGALFDSPTLDKANVNDHQEQEKKVQPSGLPTCDSTVMKTEKMEDTMKSSDSAPGVDMSVEAETKDQAYDVTTSESSSSSESSDDEDFLDLLVDTLDGEFDPELLI